MHLFFIFSLIVFVNSATVLISAGYLNNDALDWTEAVKLVSGAGLAVNIVCSALAVITHIYFTYILLDIAMSNRRKLINIYDAKVGFADAIVNWIK